MITNQVGGNNAVEARKQSWRERNHLRSLTAMLSCLVFLLGSWPSCKVRGSLVNLLTFQYWVSVCSFHKSKLRQASAARDLGTAKAEREDKELVELQMLRAQHMSNQCAIDSLMESVAAVERTVCGAHPARDSEMSPFPPCFPLATPRACGMRLFPASLPPPLPPYLSLPPSEALSPLLSDARERGVLPCAHTHLVPARVCMSADASRRSGASGPNY